MCADRSAVKSARYYAKDPARRKKASRYVSDKVRKGGWRYENMVMAVQRLAGEVSGLIAPYQPPS